MTDFEQRGFATPWNVPSREGCWFYHTMDIPGEEPVIGTWDMRGKAHQYFGNVDLVGKSVLDVGTASGFLSFEAEKLGASKVVGIDAWKGSIREMVPIRDYRENREKYRKMLDDSMIQMKKGYWYAHSRLGSKVQAYYGDIYDIPDEVGDFDVAIIGQILVHLKHPLSCIEQVAARVKPGGHLVITEGTYDSREPVAKFLWTPSNRVQTFSWWHLSQAFFERFLTLLDFELVSQSEDTYGLADPSGKWGTYNLPTFVFRRLR